MMMAAPGVQPALLARHVVDVQHCRRHRVRNRAPAGGQAAAGRQACCRGGGGGGRRSSRRRRLEAAGTHRRCRVAAVGIAIGQSRWQSWRPARRQRWRDMQCANGGRGVGHRWQGRRPLRCLQRRHCRKGRGDRRRHAAGPGRRRRRKGHPGGDGAKAPSEGRLRFAFAIRHGVFNSLKHDQNAASSSSSGGGNPGCVHLGLGHGVRTLQLVARRQPHRWRAVHRIHALCRQPHLLHGQQKKLTSVMKGSNLLHICALPAAPGDDR